MKLLQHTLPLVTLCALSAPHFAHDRENFRLTASDGAAGDVFGSAVAIDVNTIAVSAPLADGLGVDSGAVYIYCFDGTSWIEVAKLTASNASAGAQFGSAVSIDGDRLIIGAKGANSNDGAAYAFGFDGTSWNESAILSPAGLPAGAGLGASVSIEGDTAVIGAPNSSVAYVFVDGLSGWGQEAALSANGSVPGDRFGAAVTVSGDLIAIGAPNGTGNSAFSGVANLFSRSAGVWTEGQALFLPVGRLDDQFGAAIDMYAGTEILIGIPGHDSLGAEAGAGQLWRLSGSTWVVQQNFAGRDAQDRMGVSVSVYNRLNVLGVPGDDDRQIDGGTAFRNLQNSTTPLEVYVASDNATDDLFGASVATCATWSVTGAPGHASSMGIAYVHASVRARVKTSLTGSGVNPDILRTVAGPVIGQTWDIDIDLSLFPESERTTIVVKTSALTTPITIALGEVFFPFSAPIVIRQDALGSHSIPISNFRSLLDVEYTVMGIVRGAAVDGYPILALTNGETVIVGTSDLPTF